MFVGLSPKIDISHSIVLTAGDYYIKTPTIRWGSDSPSIMFRYLSIGLDRNLLILVSFNYAWLRDYASMTAAYFGHICECEKIGHHGKYDGQAGAELCQAQSSLSKATH